MHLVKNTTSSKSIYDSWMQCLGTQKQEAFMTDSNVFVGESVLSCPVMVPHGSSNLQDFFIRGMVNIVGAPLIGQTAQSTLCCRDIYLIGGKIKVQNTNLNYRYLFVMTPEQFEKGVLQHPNKYLDTLPTNQQLPQSFFASHSGICPIHPNTQDNLASILKAAQVNDVAMVQFCVAAGIDHGNTIQQKTALMEAAENNNVSAIQPLIEARAEVNARDANGNTSLMSAARGNHLQCAQLLLAAKADISAKNSYLTTPTSFAVNAGSAEMLSLFVGAGVDPFKERSLGKDRLSAGVMYAAVNGDTNTLNHLLKLGKLIDAENLSKDTALTLAAKYGQTAVVDLLIQKKADVQHGGKKGTALDYAVRNGHTDTILTLHSAGAKMATITLNELNALGDKNAQALDTLILELITSKPEKIKELLTFTMQSGKKHMIESLFRMGFHFNISNQTLTSAAINGHAELVELFLKWGADEVTALSSLIKSGNLQATQLLIQKGVILDKERFGALRLLQHAILINDPEKLNTLLDFNINPNATDSDGTTALMYAAQRGNLQMTQKLIDANAYRYAKDDQGKTALHHACLDGQVAIVEWFLSKNVDGTPKFNYSLSDLSSSIAQARAAHKVIRHAQKKKKTAEQAPYAKIITLLGNAIFDMEEENIPPEKMSVAQQMRALKPKNTVNWADEQQKPFLHVLKIEAIEGSEQKTPP